MALLVLTWTIVWPDLGVARSSVGPDRSDLHEADTLRVLFVGNSYTYYNNLPGMLEALARSEASAAPAVRTGMVASGGASLVEHAEREETVATLRGGDWDVLVLQAQSTFGRVHLVDGRMRVGDADRFFEGVKALHRAAVDAGVRTVLLEHWKRREAPDGDGSRIAWAFMRMGRESGLPVAPVGTVWRRLLEDGRLRAPLYADDGSHPAPAGSYAAAVVLYGVLTGRSTVGLPSRLRGAPVDRESGEVAVDSTVVLADPGVDQARLVQTVADEVIGRLDEAGGYLDVPDPGPPEHPAPPAGRPLEPDRLPGRWEGPLTVYPYPARLVLEIARSEVGWSATAEIRFGGEPDDIRIDDVDLRVTEEGIWFVDPEGPDGGEVRYRGVWTGSGLAGVAEIVVPRAPVYGIGSWTLSRVHRGGQGGAGS